MKRLILFFLSISIYFVSYSQDASDALRLSKSMNYGSARFVSMGGAFGALGADFTSLSYNPAGLGVFRSSEFSFTPSIKSRIDDTKYLGSQYSDSRTRFSFDNLGIITSFKPINEEEQGLVMLNFGIGYNRINDFYSETTAFGANDFNSIMDYYAGLAHFYNFQDLAVSNDYDPFRSTNAPWDAILAYNTFLIDTATGSTNEYWPALLMGDGVNQDQSISSEGGIGEYVFSLAANISNKLYLGATIGVQDVYLNQTIYYSESAFSGNGTLPNGERFESMNYNQNLVVEGTGVNLKVGAIYRPIPNLRVGIAAHTPTYFNLNEKYNATMRSTFNVGNSTSKTPNNLYDYRIETPYKLIGSLAYTFGGAGLLSVDYEYVDYSTMRFGKGGDGYRFIDENQDIKNTFTSTYNLKVGGEFWLKHLALRGGYALYGTPFKVGFDLSSSPLTALSGGFGLRLDNFTLDWAYQRLMFSDKYLPYAIAPETIERDITQNRFLLTLGFKF